MVPRRVRWTEALPDATGHPHVMSAPTGTKLFLPFPGWKREEFVGGDIYATPQRTA
jgi:hypothetical protein